MLKSSQLINLKLFLFALALLLLVNIPAFSGSFQAEDSLKTSEKTSVAEELIRGERLFYGLVYHENSVNCASCHNTEFSDTLNWNPSAIEISEKYLEKSVDDLSDVLLSPSGEKMAQVHNNFQLSTDDIRLLKLYMDKLTVTGLKESKPDITNIILFIAASFLFLFSLADLIVTKKVRPRWLHFIILLVTVSFITYRLVADAVSIGHSPGYEPDQPIKFSHRVHAGQNQTDCLYCHFTAPLSKSAGIPPENVCMNCHLLVRQGTRSGMFEINKVINSYESEKPIEWIRVYNLPDHVFFSHAQHVGAGSLKCQECHGPVETMDRIKLNQELTMGWCINCHRSTDVNFNGNKFYSEYRELYGKMKNGEMKDVTAKDIGGTECMKCHY
jgi:cytochrome c553